MPTRGSLRLESSSYSDATLSGSGLRSATMRFSGTGDSGKTVVYTDAALNRELLKHYPPGRGSQNAPAPQPHHRGRTGLPAALPAGKISVTDKNWKVSHGFRSSITGTDGDNMVEAMPPDDKTATSYSGSLHGVSGRFVCSGAACQVQLTPMYEDADNEPTRIYARHHRSARLGVRHRLDRDRKRRRRVLQAHERYRHHPLVRRRPGGRRRRVHGVWLLAQGSGQRGGGVPVRALRPGLPQRHRHDFKGDDSATYGGIAVGAYVEKDPTTAVDTYRQGEFTANVNLRATRGSTEGVLGTIGDFVTTPVGGSTAPTTAARWIITLNDGLTCVSLGQTTAAG